jgi:hypothetical protein
MAIADVAEYAHLSVADIKGFADELALGTAAIPCSASVIRRTAPVQFRTSGAHESAPPKPK